MKQDSLFLSAVGAKAAAEQTLQQLSEVDDPQALIAPLSPQDLNIVWNTADDEQRIELLGAATKAQTDALVDLRCWPSDRPNLDAVEQLIAPLATLNIDGAAKIFQQLEPELRTLILKRFVRIHVLEDVNEEIQPTPGSEVIPFPDGKYFVEYCDPDLVSQVQRNLYDALKRMPFEEYQRELECVHHDLPSELEETAFRWRGSRLADLGFASRAESIAWLSPRTIAEASRLIEEQTQFVPQSPLEGITLPVLYSEQLQGHAFLDRVLELLANTTDAEQLERASLVGPQLTAMINRFITATQTDIGDVEEVTRRSQWARNLLALGLHRLAEGDPLRGAQLLCAAYPGVFLQVSLGLLQPLRRRATQLLADPRITAPRSTYRVFDSPYHSILLGLVRQIPVHWPAASKGEISTDAFEPSADQWVAYATQEEVDATAQYLEEAEQLPGLLTHGLGFEPPLPPETSASMLLLTALANASTGDEIGPHPLSPKNAQLFRQQALVVDEQEFLTDALSALATVTDIDPRISPEAADLHPRQRLIKRLLKIGRQRLDGNDLTHMLLLR